MYQKYKSKGITYVGGKMKNRHLRMLNPRLDSTTVKQNEPASQFDGEKGIRDDINCVLADGTTAQVEMQGRIDGDRRDIADGLRRSKEEGIRIGEKRGKEQGMNEKAVATAKNFLAMNILTHEQIAHGVGLPLEKIEELSAEMTKKRTLQEV